MKTFRIVWYDDNNNKLSKIVEAVTKRVAYLLAEQSHYASNSGSVTGIERVRVVEIINVPNIDENMKLINS